MMVKCQWSQVWEVQFCMGIWTPRNLVECRVLAIRVKSMATVHKGQENSLQVLSFSSEDNVETGQGWLHVSHTAIRLRLWRNIFPHFTSILPFFISFKMHTHSITNSHTVGMFKVSLNTMRQKKAKKSCNLIQSKQIGFKITVKFCEISISHIQAATCCLGSH